MKEIKEISFLLEKQIILGNLNEIKKILTFESPIRVPRVPFLGECTIGAFSYIGNNCEIKNANIGRFCSIATNVSIGVPEHPVNWVSSHPFQYDGLNYFKDNEYWKKYNGQCKFQGNNKRTNVGNDVWIGRNVIIRQGITIGDGAIIAANSFVNKDVEPYSIVGGTPAKHIKFRFDCKIRMQLLESKWWDWIPIENEKLNFNFDNPEVFLEQFHKQKEIGNLEIFKPYTGKIENIKNIFYYTQIN